jgi:antitoxin PrlF
MEMSMAITLEEISTITAKGQTTIPKAVRQALGVNYGGRIAFRVSDGAVTVCRADGDEDPAIDGFLAFLAADLKRRPEAVKGLTPELAERIKALTADVPVNLDDAIDGDVAL